MHCWQVDQRLGAPMTHVLVVDDDEPTRDVLRLMLEDVGYAVSEAVNGAGALQALRESGEPQLVLLDLDLPGTDGLDVLEAVAADPSLAQRHRFILLTAVSEVRWTRTQPMREALDVPLLLKPFDIGDLLSAIADAAESMSNPALMAAPRAVRAQRRHEDGEQPVSA